jgi:hypothetical protein|tara:strand:- start:7511 stop:7783 length:273 start_codon:yes stop_codon:yes gene_type:complete
MLVVLKQAEIELAITSYMAAQGISRPVTAMEFTAGRGSSGISADVRFDPIASSIQENCKEPTANAVMPSAIPGTVTEDELGDASNSLFSH